MAGKPISVVKIGGGLAENDASILYLAEELKNLMSQDNRILLVHGGGHFISEMQQRYEITPRFIDGLRQTTPKEMFLVDSALAGRANKHLVRLLSRAGVKAWGLSGADAGILLAESIRGSAKENCTGRIVSVDNRPLTQLWDAAYLPIFAPVASDKQGMGINVNADEAALALAVSLKVENLVFFSDVPGVLENNRIIRHLSPQLAEEKIVQSVISNGMIPKVRSAIEALNGGVVSVFIGKYSQPGDLKKTVSGLRGTLIARGDS